MAVFEMSKKDLVAFFVVVLDNIKQSKRGGNNAIQVPVFKHSVSHANRDSAE